VNVSEGMGTATVNSSLQRFGFYRVKHPVRTLVRKDVGKLGNPNYVVTGVDCPFPWEGLSCEGCLAAGKCSERRVVLCTKEEQRLNQLKGPLRFVEGFAFEDVDRLLGDLGVPSKYAKHVVRGPPSEPKKVSLRFVQVVEVEQYHSNVHGGVAETWGPIVVVRCQDGGSAIKVRLPMCVEVEVEARLNRGMVGVPAVIRVHSNAQADLCTAHYIVVETYEELVEALKQFISTLQFQGFKVDPALIVTEWVDHLYPGMGKEGCCLVYEEGDCRGCPLFPSECESTEDPAREEEWRAFAREWNKDLPPQWQVYEEFTLSPGLFPDPTDLEGDWDEYIGALINALPLSSSSSYSFEWDEERALRELAKDIRWAQKVEAYRLYRRGMLQDDIARKFGITQSWASRWISAVKGEVGRIMGKSYEGWVKRKLEARADVDSVVYDGRHARPDFVVYLKDGSVEVIAAKCYYSERRSVSIPRSEFEPELLEAWRLKSKGLKVRLFIDYCNAFDGYHEVKEVDLEDPPATVLFTRQGG